jgi:hypothetical protein
MGSRGVQYKVCVDRIRSRGCSNRNHHGPLEIRLIGILIFRGVVVGIAKANNLSILLDCKEMYIRQSNARSFSEPFWGKDDYEDGLACEFGLHARIAPGYGYHQGILRGYPQDTTILISGKTSRWHDWDYRPRPWSQFGWAIRQYLDVHQHVFLRESVLVIILPSKRLWKRPGIRLSDVHLFTI